MDVGDLRRDLEAAAAAVRPAVLKLTGGEPLLHPDVLGCLEAVRASRIAEQVSVTTNGFLLSGVREDFYRLVDRLTLSFYPSAPLPEAVLARVEERCERAGVLLTVKSAPRFQRMDAPAPFLSEAEARRVHSECWLKTRCHMIYRGHFYTCTRPPHIEARLRGLGLETRLADEDGVALHAAGLVSRLLAHLGAEEALASCRYCLGPTGDWEDHRQMRPEESGVAAGARGALIRSLTG